MELDLNINEDYLIWESYPFVRGKKIIFYSIKIYLQDFIPLWNKFKDFQGSQKDFYFMHVNPDLKVREVNL